MYVCGVNVNGEQIPICVNYDVLCLTLTPKAAATNAINTLKKQGNLKSVVHNISVDNCKKIDITKRT